MPAMSAEEFKATARRFVEELYNKGNTAVVDELVAPDFVYHTSNPAITPDREGLRKEPAEIRSHFPDLRGTVEDVITEGEKGVMRWTLRGTHEGAYRGIPPTHKRVEWSGVIIWRNRDGKMVEAWNFPDRLGLLQQLGTFPQAATGQQTTETQPDVLA